MALQPVKVDKFETGLVEDRPDFALKDDSFTTLQNAYVFRERLQKKRGSDFIGRLRRVLTAITNQVDGVTAMTNNFAVTGADSFNIFTVYGVNVLEPEAGVEAGSASSNLVITIDPGGANETILTDATGTGVFVVTGGPPFITSATISYATGLVSIVTNAMPGVLNITLTMNYYPTLPVMGIWQQELTAVNDEQTLIFDTRYCYRYNSVTEKFQELDSTTLTTWTGSNSDFFWGTNYWNVSSGANQLLLFWVTNGTGRTGDPIRYYHPGTPTWTNFGNGGATGKLDAGGTVFLNQARILEPFRSRLIAFNTWEGNNLAGSQNYPNRIRWCQIGNPIAADSWQSDIRGKGGFLDLPVNEKIISVGFVRDNLIVYCERSTWKLRYTGQSIAPFAPEKINTELGVESTFSPINFDTYNVGVGDKGIVQTDSYQATRIDYKIPDLVYTISNENNGVNRVHGLRDFEQRIAFWTYCDINNENVFPNKRLVYNYENDSWAIFDDSYTALGVFQTQQSLRWQDVDDEWQEMQQTWNLSPAALKPENIGGNQKGYVSYIDAKLTQNDVSLPIEGITLGSGVNTELTIVNHNLEDEQFITIQNIVGTADYTSLNGNTYKIRVVDNDTIRLLKYDSTREVYTSPFSITASVPSNYVGLGEVSVKDQFSIITKKFNFLDQGKNTVFAFMDILCDTTYNGEFALNAYVDYSAEVSNTSRTVQSNPNQIDPFFNTVISTEYTSNEPLDTTKTFQRVNCNFRGRFISLEFTYNDKQMNGNQSFQEVNIYNYVLWMRPGGHLGF
ncbi:MAG: hypothetical protein PQJ44_06905 [Sphaerochaetaceae bacterium]|nr:hypothetical protein [Sphaerochaetaceae bacterium]